MSGDRVEVISPYVAIMATSETPDRNANCMRCGKPGVVMPGFVYDWLKRWNREENEAAQREDRKQNFISSNECVCCDDCIPLYRKELDERAAFEFATTEVYLRDLKLGRYSPQTLSWLRSHGHARTVTHELLKFGTDKLDV